MRLFRRQIRFHRRLAAAAVVALLALVVVLALIPLPGAIGEAFDSLLRSLFTAGMLAALAYLWYFAWVSDRTTQKLLEAARRDPERLFLHPRELGTARVIGRDSLVEELQTNLSPELNTGPQIVVGDTGAGKTSLLLSLATSLAEDEVLPIVISLRDSGNGSGRLDFGDLARARFAELVDPHVKADTDADKLWRWMNRKNKVAILADDLDRCAAATSDGHKGEVRAALDAARRRQLPVVVTTRPSGLPLDLPDPPIDLAQRPLVMRDGRGYKAILSDAGKGERHRDLVKANVEAGNLVENAFYVDLVARLLRVDALEAPEEGRGKHAVRIDLLDAWRDVLCGRKQVSEEEYERQDELLEQVESLALAWLNPEVRRDADGDLIAARVGERHDLLYLDEQIVPRFRNEVLHAYFASRAIEPAASDWLAAVEETPDSARVQLALVFAAAAGQDPAFCRLAIDRLLDSSDGADADQKLLRAAAAAEIARAGGFEERDDEIAKRCMDARPQGGPVAKRTALDQIALLGGEAAIKALWEFGKDPDYDTRWEAVQRLTQRCTSAATRDDQRHRKPFGFEAYEMLETDVQEALESGTEAAGENLDDWDERIVALKQLAWMLPSLRCRAVDTKLKKTVSAQLAILIELEREEVTKQRGLEASIAQGFKAAAWLSPREPIPPDAKERLSEARFWYSQLNLVHAISLQMAALPDRYGSKDLEELVKTIPRGSGRLHPLLRYATHLCGKALNAPPRERQEQMKRVVWDDEGAVASGRVVELAPKAVQLVGEITVLLNLNETGDRTQRESFGTENRLPFCLKESKNRLEFQNECPAGCSFDLCPFHPVRDRPSAHRELSSSFCRDQSRNASKRVARRWRSRVTKQALGEFWERLEKQARY